MTEVDFVARRQEDTIYVQVGYQHAGRRLSRHCYAGRATLLLWSTCQAVAAPRRRTPRPQLPSG
jgi:hypothetical protein